MALNVIPGDPAADSYADVPEADAWIELNPHDTTWDSLTTPDKENLLKWARVMMDSDPRAWTGAKSTAFVGAALRWPRDSMLDIDGAPVLNTVNPIELKNAQSEYARQLNLSNRTGDNSVERQGISEVKAGSVSVKFDTQSDENSDRVLRTQREANAQYAMMPDAVIQLLVPSWLVEDAEDAQNSTLIFEALP